VWTYSAAPSFGGHIGLAMEQCELWLAPLRSALLDKEARARVRLEGRNCTLTAPPHAYFSFSIRLMDIRSQRSYDSVPQEQVSECDRLIFISTHDACIYILLLYGRHTSPTSYC